jgi:hypothetical protein
LKSTFSGRLNSRRINPNTGCTILKAINFICKERIIYGMLFLVPAAGHYKLPLSQRQIKSKGDRAQALKAENGNCNHWSGNKGPVFQKAEMA